MLVHTDAAQSVGKIPTRVNELGVDLLSLAGHKLHAPKGVGALFIRRGTRIEPFVHGAGHEQGRRAGQVGADVLARLSGLAASTGSACHAGSVELSPVLAAMGVPPREGMGAIRFSLGRTTTWEELEQVLSGLGLRGPDRGQV